MTVNIAGGEDVLVKIACYLLNFYIQDITKPAVYYIFYIQGIEILNIKEKKS